MDGGIGMGACYRLGSPRGARSRPRFGAAVGVIAKLKIYGTFVSPVGRGICARIGSGISEERSV